MEFTVESIKKALEVSTGGAPYEYAWDCGFDGLSEDTVWDNLVVDIWYQVDPDEAGNDKDIEVIREAAALPNLRQHDLDAYETLVGSSFRQW